MTVSSRQPQASTQETHRQTMDVLYHLTITPPKMPDFDAVVQDVRSLQDRFGGHLIHINPNPHLPVHLPRICFGFHKLRHIRALEQDARIHHFFNPDPFPFPVLKRLRRPIVYSVTGGVGDQQPNIPFFSSLAAITVTDKRSLQRLRSWGLDNVLLARPGIDTLKFAPAPMSVQSETRLMVGSAPGNRAQFQQKGIDALLTAAQRSPQLRLTFLWRGVLAKEMARRIHRRGLEKQVDVLDRKVDVNAVLAGVHASISLATDARVIRPYPHSLIESLAAGKPVIVSKSIAMADYVTQVGCGKIVERVDPASILHAIAALTQDYEALQLAARRVGQRDFSKAEMIASFERIYEHVLERAERG